MQRNWLRSFDRKMTMLIFYYVDLKQNIIFNLQMYFYRNIEDISNSILILQPLKHFLCMC